MRDTARHLPECAQPFLLDHAVLRVLQLYERVAEFGISRAQFLVRHVQRSLGAVALLGVGGGDDREFLHGHGESPGEKVARQQSAAEQQYACDDDFPPHPLEMRERFRQRKKRDQHSGMKTGMRIQLSELQQMRRAVEFHRHRAFRTPGRVADQALDLAHSRGGGRWQIHVSIRPDAAADSIAQQTRGQFDRLEKKHERRDRLPRFVRECTGSRIFTRSSRGKMRGAQRDGFKFSSAHLTITSLRLCVKIRLPIPPLRGRLKSRLAGKAGVLACQGRQAYGLSEQPGTAICLDSRDGCLPSRVRLFRRPLRQFHPPLDHRLRTSDAAGQGDGGEAREWAASGHGLGRL